MINIKDSVTSLVTYISGALGLMYTVQDIESIASIVCTAICIASMVITFIINLINKIKIAKSDGVITKEEMDDIKKTIKDGVDEISDEIKNKDKGEK